MIVRSEQIQLEPDLHPVPFPVEGLLGPDLPADLVAQDEALEIVRAPFRAAHRSTSFARWREPPC
jgi:hypothetical protein